jgi:ABC-type oligopeptide transport system substrate-binding subunit
MKHARRLSVIVFCVISTLLSWWKIGGLYFTLNERQKQAFAYGQQQAARVQEQINAEFVAQMSVVDAIANDLSSGVLAYENLSARLRSETANKSNIYELGAAFEPYRFNPTVRLFGPDYYKDDTGQFVRVQTEEFGDYTDLSDPNNAWYYQTVEQAASNWHMYYDRSTRSYLVEYTAPFFVVDAKGKEKTVAGVIYISHSLDTIKQFTRSIDVGQEGYTTLTADTGVIVVHPDTAYVNKTVEKVVQEFNLPSYLVEDTQKAIAGEAVDRESISNNKPVWMFSRPLISPGWFITVVIKQNANAPSPDFMVREMLWIGLLVCVSVLSAAELSLRVQKDREKRLWGITIIAAIVLIGYISYIWEIVHIYPPRTAGENILVNAANVDDIANPLEDEAKLLNQSAPIRIPTGVLIKTIGVAPLNTSISGYIWQKYPVGLSENVTRGFRFPDDLSGVSIREVYRFTKGDVETIGWFFIVTLQQIFDTERYPLDQANIIVKIWPAELDDNLLLVPDFAAYESMAPSELPGLDEGMRLAGWQIQRSYFSFVNESYNTDMGSAAIVQRSRMYSLTFNVNATRNLLSPLIAYCITAIVVASMFFGIQMVNIETPYNVLSNSSALFFIVAITHVGLRGALNASGVVYLEYIFILEYVFILLGAINGLLYYGNKRDDWIHYEDNLIPRLAYWPVFLMLLLVTTLATFYPTHVPEDSIDTNLKLNDEIVITPTPYSTPTAPNLASNAPQSEESSATPQPIPSKSFQRTADSITLRYPIFTSPTTLDPSLSNRYDSTEQIGNLFIGLTRLDPLTLEPQPSLATHWEISENGLVWTFHLRSDIPWVQFSPNENGDGGEARQVTDRQGNPRYVSAADVAYGIQRALLTKNPSAQLLFVIQNAEDVFNSTQPADALGVNVLDAATLAITLKGPAPYLPELLAYDITYAAPQWSVDEWADNWTDVGRINTSGPYMLAGFEKDKRLALVKNPFWPQADEVQIEWIDEPILNGANPGAIIEMYRKHELDTIGNPPGELLDAIQSNAVLAQEQVTYPRLCVQYIGFVNTKTPFNDVRVRQAFSAAIDRQFIATQVLRNGSLPAQVLAPPGVFGAATDPSAGQGYDPTLAQELFNNFLKERGLTVAEFNTAYQLKFGQLSSGNAVNSAIVDGWREVLGVEVKLITAPNDDLSPYDRKTVPVEKAFHMFQGNWCADYPDQDNFVRFLFNSQNGSNGVRRNCADANCSKVNPPTLFDTLTIEAANITDPEARKQRYIQAEQILAVDEAAYAPIFFDAATAITKEWLTRNYPSFGPPDFYAWVIDKASQIIP